jgi:hypothetical protein
VVTFLRLETGEADMAIFSFLSKMPHGGD